MSQYHNLECRTDLTAEQRQRVFAGLERFRAAVGALRYQLTREGEEENEELVRNT